VKWRIFYYETPRGECPVQEFLQSLSLGERAKCLAYMDLLEEQPLHIPANIAKQVEGKLWELRPEASGVEMRLLYFFFVERQIVFVHALKKKRQALERGDIELALKRMAEVQAEAPTIRARVPNTLVPEPSKDKPKRKGH
jgi:phage-related protein